MPHATRTERDAQSSEHCARGTQWRASTSSAAKDQLRRDASRSAHTSRPQLASDPTALGSPPRATQGALDAASSQSQSRAAQAAPNAPLTAPSSPPHAPPLYASIPLPSQVAGVTRTILHPVLAGSCRYDLSLPPPIASLGPCIYESATWPAVPSLAIEMPLLPSPIVVHAAAYIEGGSAFVAVADVLEALYVDLQQPAIGYERRGERVARHVSRGMLISSEDACARVGQRIQRGELLRGQRMFAGLSPSPLGGEVYTLHVA
ncbi:uncharacterized protein SCHCODRAFT_02556378 [Schizophyllum commune H4-8]|nr:uncharacterized protein SCHCODRAFT_02556378 [Schizophyllum commune H4-8]KAI5885976.1 hypothetical protein SCHCODRAFT_02556378 [Schizophyllum commune H4-8]